MCKVNQYPVNTIVLIHGSNHGIVVGYDIYHPHVHTVFNQQGLSHISYSQLESLTDSYVGIQANGDDLLLDYLEQLTATNDVIIEEHHKKQLAMVEELNKETSAKLKKAKSQVKPSDKFKTIHKVFHFNSKYTPNGIDVIVHKEYNGKAELYFGQNKLNDTDLSNLYQLLYTQIGGLTIAPDTIKLGEVIGNTQVLKDAHQYYASIS